jgi:hypothetical protein
MAQNSYCDLSPGQYSQGIASQVSTLRQELIRYVALNDPYANLVEGGTTANNSGTEIKTLVTSRMVTGQSLTRPAFTDTAESCNLAGPQAKFGQTEFTSKLQTLRGEGPIVCLNKARYEVIDSYKVAEMNLKDAVKTLNSADIRAQMLTLSGVKAVLNTGATSLGQILTGGYNQVAVPFLGGVPSAPVTHKFLVALTNYMRDNLSPEFFGDGVGQHFVFIAGSDQIETLRNEAGVKQDVLGFATGGFKDAKDALQKYTFAEYPYRGVKMAIDQQPLRFNTVNGSGFPNFIEPLVETVTDYGVENATNPDWVSAKYEVGFLVSKNAFKRLVPERFIGEGSFKFDAQFVMGELNWHYVKDNCNKWGDFGQHLYQIVRAFQSKRPHGVIPILYRRCAQDLGLNVSCSEITTDLSI